MLIQNKKETLSNWTGNVSLWLVLFLTLGYPIQAAIPILLHVPSTPINVAFRVVYAIISLILIVASMGKRKNISRGAAFLLFFWGIYSVRLVVDISYRGIVLGTKDSFFMYSMAFGNCLLPMVAIIFTSKYVDVRNLYKKLYGIVVFSNLLIILLIFLQNGGFSASLLDTRADITGQNSDEHVINTIVVGFYGNVLFTLSLYFLMFFNLKNILTKSAVLFFCLIGLFNLIIAASRGPFLATLVIFVFLLYVKYKTTNFKKRFLFKTLVLLSLTAYFLTASGFLNNIFERSALFSRMEDFYNNSNLGAKENRNYEYASAFNQFYNNPILGDQYVTKYDSFYPHNIYLEVLMSLGIVGGVLFLLLHVEIIKRTVFIIKKRDFLYFCIVIVVVICFLAAMTSGGMALNPGIWAITALFVSINYKQLVPSLKANLNK